MAGDLILRATDCAVVFVNDELLARNEHVDAHDPLVWLQSRTNAINAPLLNLSTHQPFLLNQPLQDAVAELKKHTLLLAGGSLEGAVTQLAITSLLDGFDVYICADLTVCYDPLYDFLYFNRIRACAGNVVTSRQIVLELLAQETDQDVRNALSLQLNVIPPASNRQA